MASMAEAPIQEGDNVSWKWGSGEPTGTVAEVKTDGQLEIKSKGKLVHKNADPSNPAVHVAREGNDVVKRASELTKLDSPTDTPGEEQEAGLPTDAASAPAPAAADEQANETAAGPSAAPAPDAHAKPASKKRAPRKKSNAAATAGDKRERAEPTAGAEGEAAEKETGKKTKKTKAKTAEGGEAESGDHDAATKGAKKGPGRPRKGSKAKKAKGDEHEHAEEAMVVDAAGAVVEGEGAPVKKRGPGRPKKSDAADHPPPAAAAGGAEGDIVAARTRSKGE